MVGIEGGQVAVRQLPDIYGLGMGRSAPRFRAPVK